MEWVFLIQIDVAGKGEFGAGIGTLICDDAPQFKLLTETLGLCWIHDGRYYKKAQSNHRTTQNHTGRVPRTTMQE